MGINVINIYDVCYKFDLWQVLLIYLLEQAVLVHKLNLKALFWCSQGCGFTIFVRT